MKYKVLIALALSAAVLAYPVMNVAALAREGRYREINADTAAGERLLAAYDAVSVETAQEHIDSAQLAYRDAVAAANLQQSIEDEIVQIEQGELTYREVFRDVYVGGDSLMCGLSSYGLINGSHLMAKVNANLSHLESNLPRIISAKPRVLILHYGVNAVSTGEAAAQRFIRRYSNLIDKIKSGSPNTRIIISLIFPVNEAAAAREEKFGGIERYNTLMMQMCEEKEIEFLDSTQLLREHDEYYTADGVHQNKNFYVKYWFPHIMKEMEIY